MSGCRGACPSIGAGVGRGGSRARHRLRSRGAQRISRVSSLSHPFLFMSLAQGRAGRLERSKLLSQRHLVFAQGRAGRLEWSNLHSQRHLVLFSLLAQTVFSSASRRESGCSEAANQFSSAR